MAFTFLEVDDCEIGASLFDEALSWFCQQNSGLCPKLVDIERSRLVTYALAYLTVSWASTLVSSPSY
jgi:hypothetical protein